MTSADEAATVTANDATEISDGRRAGAVMPVDLDRQRVQDVRQRQPDRADLLPAWA